MFFRFHIDMGQFVGRYDNFSFLMYIKLCTLVILSFPAKNILGKTLIALTGFLNP